MRRFFMTTDAETALASSWQGMMFRNKLQSLGGCSHVGEPTVQPQSVPRPVEEKPVPQFEWVYHQAQEPDLKFVQEQVKQARMIAK